LKIFFESGRAITGPYGYLVSRVLHIKDTYKKYEVWMLNMEIYAPCIIRCLSSYYSIGKRRPAPQMLYDVTGSLCENNDKFAIKQAFTGNTCWRYHSLYMLQELTDIQWGSTTTASFVLLNFYSGKRRSKNDTQGRNA
jgi:hypothetical protein